MALESVDLIPTPDGASRSGRGLGIQMSLLAWRTTEFRIGFGIFLALIVLSILGPSLVGLSPTQIDVASRFIPPLPFEGSGLRHLLGTDQLGRDLLVRSLIGLRNALMIGVASVIGMFIVGSIIGMLAGYFGGWVDLLLMRLTDAQMAIPIIILAITILGVSRPNPLSIILVLVLAGWPAYSRISRAVTLSERRKEYVRAAMIVGSSDVRTIIMQVAPNILPPIAFVAVLDVARMMIFEAIFGFIGIGIQPPTPTFGTIIADGTKYLLSAWWITTVPGVLLAICLCSINLMGGSLERARNKLLRGI
jgi:peptide/nickel transport system permease protein